MKTIRIAALDIANRHPLGMKCQTDSTYARFATELAELVWDDAGKPAPAAALDTDATNAQKALTWASENQLLPSNKTADASVSYWEVIQIWRKAQALKN